MINLESKIIAKICLEDKMEYAAQKGVTKKYFFEEHSKWVFIKDYFEKYGKLSYEALKTTFSDIPEREELEFDLDFLIDKLKSNFLKASLANLLDYTMRGMSGEPDVKSTIDNLSNKVQELSLLTVSKQDTNLIKDATERVKELERRRERVKEKGLIGIPTGIDVLNNYTGGIIEGDVWVIVGRTGMGKSWLLLKMAVEAWKAGYKPLMVNLEMNAYEVGYRMDTLISKEFSNLKLMQGKISDEDFKRYKKFITQQSKNNDFWLVTRIENSISFTINDLQSKILEYNPDVVYLDYLNLINPTQKFRSIWEKVTVLTRDLKRLAMRYVPIVIVVQAGRGAAKQGYTPKLHHIANSDSVGRDSDKILSIVKVHYEQDDKEYMMCSLIKNRGGKEMGKIWLRWDIDKGKIESYKMGEEPANGQEPF